MCAGIGLWFCRRGRARVGTRYGPSSIDTGTVLQKVNTLGIKQPHFPALEEGLTWIWKTGSGQCCELGIGTTGVHSWFSMSTHIKGNRGAWVRARGLYRCALPIFLRTRGQGHASSSQGVCCPVLAGYPGLPEGVGFRVGGQETAVSLFAFRTDQKELLQE